MAINTTFTTGAVLTAAQMNNLPWGVAGLQTLTSTFTTSPTHTNFQDTGMTLTITEVSGRRYRLNAKMNIYPSGGLQGINMRFVRAAAVVSQANVPSAALDAGNGFSIGFQAVYTAVASGSATYKVQIAAATSNTAVSDFGDTVFTRQFWIEDIGPS